MTICTVSCGDSSVKTQLEKMIGQQVCLPQFDNMILKGVDTVAAEIPKVNYKMIAYYAPDECTSCNETKLYDWQTVVDYAKYSGLSFAPVFIFASSEKQKTKELNVILKSLRLDFPVYIDANNRFGAANLFIPKERRYHVFLIDKSNKVVLVGNPLNSSTVWDLYKSTITNFSNH